MHVPMNVKSPNNISKWQMGFNLAFKELTVSAWGTTVWLTYTGGQWHYCLVDAHWGGSVLAGE
jgi:hypothetical protein